MILLENHKFCRKCSITGEGMNAGFYFELDNMYIKYEADALKHVQSLGYADLKQSFDNEHHYYTEWDVKEDAEFIVKNGVLVAIDSLFSEDTYEDKRLKQINTHLIESLNLFYQGHLANGGTLDYREKQYSYISNLLDEIAVGYLGNPANGSYQEELEAEGYKMSDKEVFDAIVARFNNTDFSINNKPIS